MKTKIVTAIYTDIKHHPFYGHEVLARQERYLHSLRTLNNMNVPIICYHNDTQTKLISNYCKKFNLHNVTLKVSNLKDLPSAHRMKLIKEQTNEYKFYYEIGWNKFFLIKKELDLSCDYLYWFDAGLCHKGLFLEKYNPFVHLTDGSSAKYENYCFTKLFNDDLIKKINPWVGEKLIALLHNRLAHNTSPLYSILSPSSSYKKTVIGGIIGGNVKLLHWFINEFETACEKILSHGVLINHEAIMMHIVQHNMDKFQTFLFDTWYHEDYWKTTPNFNNDVIKDKTHFVHFFEKELGI